MLLLVANLVARLRSRGATTLVPSIRTWGRTAGRPQRLYHRSPTTLVAARPRAAPSCRGGNIRGLAYHVFEDVLHTNVLGDHCSMSSQMVACCFWLSADRQMSEPCESMFLVICRRSRSSVIESSRSTCNSWLRRCAPSCASSFWGLWAPAKPRKRRARSALLSVLARSRSQLFTLSTCVGMTCPPVRTFMTGRMISISSMLNVCCRGAQMVCCSAVGLS